MGKKILYIVIIIALIIAGIYAAKQMSEESEVTQTGANTVKNTTENKEKNETEKNTIVPEVDETEKNNIEEETTIGLNPEETAKKIVKENWGEDDTVYFSYDGIKDGKYVVCVRESSTTKELYRYYVDIETGSFEIE